MVSTVGGLVMSEGQEHSVPALVAAFPCLAPGLLLLDPADRF